MELSRERRIDWARIISNLQTVGLSLRVIAETMGMSKTQLFAYMDEDCPSEPSYWSGNALLNLWCDRCGCTLLDVPIRHVQLSVSAMLKAMR
jgi:hypothetical protein